MPAPYLDQVCVRNERISDGSAFPFSLPFVEELDLRLETPVSYFVGENGSGKSTLIEAIAVLCRLPVSGGGRHELADRHGPETGSELATSLRPSFRRRPRDGYFFRAEFQAHFATLLEERQADPNFIGGDPFARYGGRSLHMRSHGEAFLAMLTSWMAPGIILMDEPEAALSPQRQLTLLAVMARLASRGDVQFLVATHSPILLTFPGASIISFDDPKLPVVRLEDTAHFQITKGILESPARYWKHLLADDESG
jgi:predicted ATPase